MTKTEILNWFCSRKVMGEMCDTCKSYKCETYKGLSARLDKLIQSVQDETKNRHNEPKPHICDLNKTMDGKCLICEKERS